MNRLNRILATMTVVASALPASTSMAAPGYLHTTLDVVHRHRPLDLHIWYPAGDGGTRIQLGKNPVFTGHRVSTGAVPASGSHPLIVLSHGLGGNAVNIGWIAAHLAERGMVVVAPNHHGSTSHDAYPLETLKVWQRPADLSAILDYFETGGPDTISVDMSRVGAVGFSLGGFTVLSATGARVSKDLYVDYCRRFPGSWDCAWFESSGVDLESTIETRFEQSNLDDRIKVAVAIDPGLAQAFDSASLATIQTPIRIINLGARDEVPTAIDGMEISARLPNSDHFDVAGATHFSFLGICTARGETLIAEDGEEPICTGTGKRDRADIHRHLAPMIVDYLLGGF